MTFLHVRRNAYTNWCIWTLAHDEHTFGRCVNDFLQRGSFLKLDVDSCYNFVNSLSLSAGFGSVMLHQVADLSTGISNNNAHLEMSKSMKFGQTSSEPCILSDICISLRRQHLRIYNWTSLCVRLLFIALGSKLFGILT